MNSRTFLRRAPALFAAVFFLYAAPEPAGRKYGISAAAAAGDFKIMNTIFTQAHATAFAQIPAGEVPDLFKDVKRVSVRDFVVRILQYYRGIHVDHTGLGFSPELINELDIKTALFPFPLKFFEGKAYVDCDYPDIPFGSELIALNGQDMAPLLAELNDVSGIKDTSGKWDDFRLSESFSFLYYMKKGGAKEWRLNLAGKDTNKPRVVVLNFSAGVNPPVLQRRSAIAPRYAQALYMLFDPSLKGAYLAINSFMPTGGQFDSVDSWNNHMNLFHQEANAKKSENLIIDLRANRGGVMLFSAVAASWFLESPVADKSRSRTHSRLVPYPQYASAINGAPVSAESLRSLEKNLQEAYSDKMVDGYFDLRNYGARFLNIPPIPVAHKFRKIYVLIGPATYSAAVNFARILKLGNSNVTLVGEETGSPGDGHSADFLVTYKLPGSGVLIEVPLVRVDFFPLVPGQKNARGLMPDLPKHETAEDFAASRDAVLDFVSRTMASP